MAKQKKTGFGTYITTLVVDSDLTTTEARLFAFMQLHVDYRTGVFDLKRKTTCAKLDINLTTYTRALRTLIEKELVSVKHRTRGGQQITSHIQPRMEGFKLHFPRYLISELRDTAFLVYVELLNRCGRESWSLSRRVLAKKFHCSALTISRAIRQLTQEMTRSLCTAPEIEQKMEQLAGQLETVKGKKSYGYLPKSVKKTVDEVVDKLEELPVVRECYDRWCRLQGEVESYYHDKPRERKKLSQEKEFRQIKNAVIQEAERIRLGEISFEDDDLAEHDEQGQARDESHACRELWRIIRNEDISLDYRDRAAEKLEQVAERGDAHAQYRMGQLYRDGPLLIPDNRKAKQWLTQAAKQGLTEAQYALGKLLLSDDWEVRDLDEGIRWLKQAAENGSHFAAYHLGKEYLEGNAANKDTSRAADWFTKSAEAGNQYAQYMLGKLCLTGQGLPRDQAQAMMWFSRSAVQGNQHAQFFLEQRNNLHQPSVMLAVTRLLYHMSRIFEDHALPRSGTGLHIDRKSRQKLMEKRIAMGHKPDDHEEQWPEMTM